MKISFLGAAKNVTGSKHLLEVNGKKILLDCGMFQGHHKEADEWNRTLLVDPKTIDAIILSHAHIDHSGLLPYYYKNGFKGPIWSTLATRDLCVSMLSDSAFIQEKDAEYISKKLKNKGMDIIPPLYTTDDVPPTIKLFRGINYYQTIEMYPGIKFTFHDAGHILGSAFVVIDIVENGESKRLTFSGDIGRMGLPIIRDTDFIDSSDYVISESTYGDRLHTPIANSGKELGDAINDAIKRGGHVIIPSFSVGRTQELIYELHKLVDAKDIPAGLDVIVDSPLSCNITNVFQMHPECYDDEIYKEFIHNHQNPFGFKDYKCISEVEESKALNDRSDSFVLISASGMCDGGRIIHHLRNGIEDPKNTVLFVGYQAEGTLGRRILDGENPVSIFNEDKKVNAKIVRLDAFSAHGDYNELLNWTASMKGIKKIFLVHGEEKVMDNYKIKLNERIPGVPVEIPNKGDSFEL